MKFNTIVRFLLPMVFLTIPFSIAKSQGTLQFSQIKLVSSSETVPLGRVWKATGILPFQQTSWPGSPVFYNISVNGNLSTVGHEAYGRATNGSSLGTGSYSSAIVAPVFPLWLPSGTSLAAGANVRAISVIEFNIIP
jgi:hypothetical protein